ncbi:Divalent-cation tolerance protein CutA [subsurface metagenome]
MRKSHFIVIFITTATEKEAKRIADALVTQKKAACVSILPRIQSLFWWQDKIDSADEVLLVAKTESRLLDDIIKLVKKLHSYDVPEIIALPIIGGNEEYLQWINKSLRNKDKKE